MDLKKYLLPLFMVMALLSSSCSAASNPEPLQLATFVKNGVTVSIYLSTSKDGTSSLAASFAPAEGLHLYSKDIPRDGVEGLGRPTLLELTQTSQMKAAGTLMESVPPQIPDFEPRGLLVYPTGAVTLTLPITLPAGNGWVDDEISLTYMACSDVGCKAPVIDQVISVRVPGSG